MANSFHFLVLSIAFFLGATSYAGVREQNLNALRGEMPVTFKEGGSVDYDAKTVTKDNQVYAYVQKDYHKIMELKKMADGNTSVQITSGGKTEGGIAFESNSRLVELNTAGEISRFISCNGNEGSCYNINKETCAVLREAIPGLLEKDVLKCTELESKLLAAIKKSPVSSRELELINASPYVKNKFKALSSEESHFASFFKASLDCDREIQFAIPSKTAPKKAGLIKGSN